MPAASLPSVDKLRAEFFKRAADAMVRSSHRFESQHPGVTLRRIAGVSSSAVRYSMHVPFGGFDLLTELVLAKGAKRPGENELKDALYRDWKAAGLPVQLGLPSLLTASSR